MLPQQSIRSAILNALTPHTSLWNRIQVVLDKKRLPHALLFIGPRHASILQFTHRLMAMILCEGVEKPCGHCQSCHLLVQGTHPDIHYVRQDTPNGPLKIEQVRALQQDVYQTPQRGARRFIVFDPADKLNNSAANALLKILEEPPSHTLFILIAEHVSSLPSTIMSRCQQYTFPLADYCKPGESLDYLMMDQFYSEDAKRMVLFTQRLSIISSLCELVEEKISPCAVAAQWSSYVLDDILWFLCLLVAQAIRFQLVGGDATQPWIDKLMYFARLVKPVRLFKQMDQINTLMKKTHRNITLNQTLAIEALLLGFIEISK